jgi:heat-inducible transcriptional repressor
MLGERDQLLLKKLIELYLKEGRPVGSRTLSKLPEISVSPATIRNVMADLESLGLIESPHTSAGRVPTSKGLRFYVDQFLTCQPISREYIAQLMTSLQRAGEPEEAIERATTLLSDLTGMVSVVMLPDRSRERISHVALMPLTERRVLMVLVFNNQEAENRFIELDTPVDSVQLERMANFFNTELVGRSLAEARAMLVDNMAQLQAQLNHGMVQLLEGARGALEAHTDEQTSVKVAGETKLLQYEEMADIQQLRALFDAFEEQRNMLHFLDKSLQAKGLQVFIGRETGLELYEHCAVVTHPYDMGEELVGVLGVIGPRRMPYDKVIPMVDITAKILDSVLKKHYPAPLNP